MFNICIFSESGLDNPQIEEIIKNKGIEYSIDYFSSIDALKKVFENHLFKYHCIIVDIQNIISFSLVNEINDKYSHCQVIYITNNLEYARYISHTHFSYFIYKDDIIKELPSAINKILSKINESSIIQIPLKGRIKLVELNQIIYIESHLHKINIVCINENIECYKKLSDLSNTILSYPQFLRCHNSYIVNMDYIKEYGATSILMNNDVSITITRKYKDEVKELITQFYNPFLKI